MGNDGTRSVLHEVMEQQTLSIAKAGIIAQLNAGTSILAAANPIESQWNGKKTIVENIQLPHTLLSRFDLIFLILDPQDEVFDRRLGRHLVSLYYKSQQDSNEELVEMSVLRDYIAYAKQTFNPKLSDEAGTLLTQSYVRMRQVGSGRGQITAYPRQLDSLIRLAKAHARLRFSHNVEVVDVEEASRLHKEALKQSAIDPTTGTIDVSILTTGQSEGIRKRRFAVKNTLKDLIGKKGKVNSNPVSVSLWLRIMSTPLSELDSVPSSPSAPSAEALDPSSWISPCDRVMCFPVTSYNTSSVTLMG